MQREPTSSAASPPHEVWRRFQRIRPVKASPNSPPPSALRGTVVSARTAAARYPIATAVRSRFARHNSGSVARETMTTGRALQLGSHTQRPECGLFSVPAGLPRPCAPGLPDDAHRLGSLRPDAVTDGATDPRARTIRARIQPSTEIRWVRKGPPRFARSHIGLAVTRSTLRALRVAVAALREPHRPRHLASLYLWSRGGTVWPPRPPAGAYTVPSAGFSLWWQATSQQGQQRDRPVPVTGFTR